MTEQEYIQTGNLAKMRMVSMIMIDIMEGDEYGVDEKTYKEAYRLIYGMQEKLFETVKVEE